MFWWFTSEISRIHMRKPALAILLLLTVSAIAQSNHAAPSHAPTAKPSASSANLPSEDEINGFLHETFGYNPQLTWKIIDVKPAEAKGLTQVDVQISSPDGQGAQRFFVTEDGKHAVVGDIIPFGKHPFQPARLELHNRANGPARG